MFWFPTPQNDRRSSLCLLVSLSILSLNEIPVQFVNCQFFNVIWVVYAYSLQISLLLDSAQIVSSIGPLIEAYSHLVYCLKSWNPRQLQTDCEVRGKAPANSSWRKLKEVKLSWMKVKNLRFWQILYEKILRRCFKDDPKIPKIRDIHDFYICLLSK